MNKAIVGQSNNNQPITDLFETRSGPGSSHAFGPAAMVSRKKSRHRDDLFNNLNLPKEIVDAMLNDFSGICDASEGCSAWSDEELEGLRTDRILNSYKDAIDVTRCHWHTSADPIQDAAGNPGQLSLLQKQSALRDAVLSDRAYNRNSPDRLELPDGIIELRQEELPEDMACLMETESGYAASLFYDSMLDRIVIANRGTEGFIDPDGAADFRQAMGLDARQYTDAIKLAEKVHDVFDDTYTITTTGHSLGGGLASVQALFLGSTANTFNAAYVREALGQRTKLPAVSVQQHAGQVSYDRELNFFERTRQSVSLHGIRTVIASLQYSIDPNVATV